LYSWNQSKIFCEFSMFLTCVIATMRLWLIALIGVPFLTPFSMGFYMSILFPHEEHCKAKYLCFSSSFLSHWLSGLKQDSCFRHPWGGGIWRVLAKLDRTWRPSVYPVQKHLSLFTLRCCAVHCYVAFVAQLFSHLAPHCLCMNLLNAQFMLPWLLMLEARWYPCFMCLFPFSRVTQPSLRRLCINIYYSPI